ncbi:MAG TPA: sigma-70 family RNA polymerase sigma factor, partial [Gaiellaceae bacterium]
AWWIRQSIRRALTNDSRTIRLPSRLVTKQLATRRAATALEAALGRAPTLAELAAATGIEADAIELAEQAPSATASLNDAVRGTDGPGQLLDVVADATAPDPEEELEHAAQAEAVRAAVAGLREREREIVASHFGLDGESRTLDEIATAMHLAPERVRQIERHAFAALADKLDE